MRRALVVLLIGSASWLGCGGCPAGFTEVCQTGAAGTQCTCVPTR